MAESGSTAGPTAPLPHETLTEAVEVAAHHLAGSLATIHADCGTPQVSFVFFHLDHEGRVLFGSGLNAQHSLNLIANPACAFMIDNRQAIPADYAAFDRINLEGSASRVSPGDDAYPALLQALRQKNPLAARFTENGYLFCITPTRLTLYRGARSQPRVLEFPLSTV